MNQEPAERPETKAGKGGGSTTNFLQGRSSPPAIAKPPVRWHTVQWIKDVSQEAQNMIRHWRAGRPDLHHRASALLQGGPSRPDSLELVLQDPSRVLPYPGAPNEQSRPRPGRGPPVEFSLRSQHIRRIGFGKDHP